MKSLTSFVNEQFVNESMKSSILAKLMNVDSFNKKVITDMATWDDKSGKAISEIDDSMIAEIKTISVLQQYESGVSSTSFLDDIRSTQHELAKLAAGNTMRLSKVSAEALICDSVGKIYAKVEVYQEKIVRVIDSRNKIKASDTKDRLFTLGTSFFFDTVGISAENAVVYIYIPAALDSRYSVNSAKPKPADVPVDVMISNNLYQENQRIVIDMKDAAMKTVSSVFKAKPRNVSVYENFMFDNKPSEINVSVDLEFGSQFSVIVLSDSIRDLRIQLSSDNEIEGKTKLANTQTSIDQLIAMVRAKLQEFESNSEKIMGIRTVREKIELMKMAAKQSK